MFNKFKYSPNPSTTRVPLTPEEVESLLETLPSNLSKNKENLQHLLSRVLSTCLELRRIRELYAKEVEENSKAINSFNTNTVNPMHAAQFLSPEQKSKLFDKFAQEKLAALEESKSRADLRTRQAEEVIAGVLNMANAGELEGESYLKIVSFLKSLGFPVNEKPTKNLEFADPRLLDQGTRSSGTDEFYQEKSVSQDKTYYDSSASNPVTERGA
jgi:hypothetical protein